MKIRPRRSRWSKLKSLATRAVLDVFSPVDSRGGLRFCLTPRPEPRRGNNRFFKLFFAQKTCFWTFSTWSVDFSPSPDSGACSAPNFTSRTLRAQISTFFRIGDLAPPTRKRLYLGFTMDYSLICRRRFSASVGQTSPTMPPSTAQKSLLVPRPNFFGR